MNLLIAGALTGLLLLPARPAPVDPGQAHPSNHQQQQLDPSRQVAAWPLAGRPEVVAGYDPPAATWSAGHRGVDLLGSAGLDVRTALAGTVAFAGTVAGRGVVVVDHGTFRTTYEPVDAAVVRGARIATGETIGTLQAVPSHCAPRVCLHWGLVEGEAYRDPLSLIRSGRVRLLPFV